MCVRVLIVNENTPSNLKSRCLIITYPSSNKIIKYY